MAGERTKKPSENNHFNGFSEYWHFAKHMTSEQRDILFSSFSSSQKRIIKSSFNSGKWVDLLIRDQLDELVDQIKASYGLDLIEARCKVLKGQSIYVSKECWDFIQEKLSSNDEKHKSYLIGGIKGIACKVNNNVVLLVRQDKKLIEE